MKRCGDGLNKYRGVNKETEIQRGEYREVALTTGKIPFTYQKGDVKREAIGYKLYFYLRTFGQQITLSEEYCVDHKVREVAFHYGGATVGFWEIIHYTDKCYRVNLELMSNDSLDDVVDNLTKKFPKLKRVPNNSIAHIEW